MAAVVETFAFLLLVGPVCFFIVTVFILAALGKSLGFRRKYVQFLLYIFEYGRKRIEKAHKQKYGSYDDADNEDDDDVNEDDNGNRSKEKTSVEDNSMSDSSNAATATSTTTTNEPYDSSTIVQRHQANNIKAFAEQQGQLKEQSDLSNTENSSLEKPDFEFSEIFEFIKGGIEAIVEDQVTQRFVAEELKSWNLLTRTNRHYEFISWRLSFIWVLGFFIRYIIMLPFRVTICFLGTVTLTTLTFLIGLLPEGWRIKRHLNNFASKFSFRLLSRAFSAIVTYHCLENKPGKSGICVANHTSPIDVVLLACDSSFALVVCLTLTTAMVGLIPERYGPLRRRLYNNACIQSFGVLSWSISAVVTYHDTENRPGGVVTKSDGTVVTKEGGICVANHTSPIDVLVLATDSTYAMIGQRHGGFLGILQRALARASSHIWFERSEMKDREAVARRLREHVEDASKLPILIFPEGTCINNSAVMQFKKGSFDVGGVIYPVAIKYDPRFGDPFWDSSMYSMLQYLYMMMTSWAIVCDVWYLPPMNRRTDESAVDFANRVKAEIARKGGLVDLDWDGQLKRAPAKKEWKEQQQLEYSKKFANTPRHLVTSPDSTNDSPNPST